MISETVAQVSENKRRLEILLDISGALSEHIHLDQLLSVMIAKVTEAMEAERTSLFLYDARSNELYSKVAEGMDSNEIRFPITAGIAGLTARMRSPVNVPDAYKDPRFNPAFDHKTRFITKAILSVPIIDQDNQLLAVVQVLNKRGGGTFSPDDEAFLQAICVHLGLALERARLVESYVEGQRLQQALQLARDIQIGLLPKKFPAFPDIQAIDIFAQTIPALEVGGDFYDFFLLDGDRLCFIIGDVSDKGVPAALFMAVARTAFKISAMATPDSICSTLAAVNRFLVESNESQMFVTAFAGILDLRTGSIQCGDAGHEPPFVLRGRGQVEMMQKKPTMALGVLGDYVFQDTMIQLHGGDSLVLYTDGVNEAKNLSGQMFKTPTIEETLLPLSNGEFAQKVSNALLQRVTDFVGGAPQSDDITVMVLRYCGN